MGHEYPAAMNWNSTHAEIITVHVVVGILVLGAIVFLSLSRRWPAKQSNLWSWALVMIAAPFVVFMIPAPLDPDSKWSAWSFLACCTLSIWLVGLASMRNIHRRLLLNEEKSSFGCVMSVLVAAGFFLGYPALFLATSVTPREGTNRNQCKSNLKRIGIALHNYHDVFSHLPKSAAGKPAVSWRVHALPFLDHPEIYDTYDQAEAWDSDSNAPFANQQIYHLTCPSSEAAQDRLGRYFTHYSMVEGAGTIGNEDWSSKFSEMTDGTANTLAVVEAAGLNIVWTEPRDTQVSDQNLGINLTGPTPDESPALISAWHRGGGHVLMADGAAKFLSHNIDPKVLKALTTVDGGESVEGWDKR